jgi:hypothetical protein
MRGLDAGLQLPAKGKAHGALCRVTNINAHKCSIWSPRLECQMYLEPCSRRPTRATQAASAHMRERLTESERFSPSTLSQGNNSGCSKFLVGLDVVT